MGMEQKFNDEIAELLARINSRYSDKVSWDFMGIPQSRACLITHFPNVTIREAFAKPVKEFLKETDIFLFYPSWNRQECWSRSVGEALASGCPVLATDKGGNRDQIVHGNNGYLCRNLGDFVQYLSELIEDPEIVRALGRNAVLYSRFFSTEYVVKKLIEFIS
jgi:glycosyltransferase involved in cell wall biosynthesis